MAEEPTSFIREVDEELQRDRLQAIWQRYGSLIVAAAVALVVGTAGYVGWTSYSASVRNADAVRFDEALQLAATDLPGAIAALTEAGDEASTGYRAIARLTAAQLAASQDDAAAFDEALDALIADSGARELYRDYAILIRAVARIDVEDSATLRAELQPLAAAGGIWRHAAREALAAVAVKDGDLDEADRLLSEIEDDATAPPAQRERARQVREALAAKG